MQSSLYYYIVYESMLYDVYLDGKRVCEKRKERKRNCFLFFLISFPPFSLSVFPSLVKIGDAQAPTSVMHK